MTAVRRAIPWRPRTAGVAAPRAAVVGGYGCARSRGGCCGGGPLRSRRGPERSAGRGRSTAALNRARLRAGAKCRTLVVVTLPPAHSFEQGPIRPPSEAHSLLVRVTRGCSWNRCVFCPVYKGHGFSARDLAEILADLDAVSEVVALIERAAQDLNEGEVSRGLLHQIMQSPAMAPARPVAWWLFHGGRTVFLQDANALAAPEQKITEVLRGIRSRFPRVDRITSYSQTRTLKRMPPARLEAWREAGLSRVHVGLESGSDTVLALVNKGTDAASHIEAGRRVIASGLHLCCYVMPGLGGEAHSAEHAQETARVLTAIEPSAVRLRSLMVAPHGPLAEMVAAGEHTPLDDVAMVREIRAMLAAMDNVETSIVSDHDLNLLPELEGRLPADLPGLLEICDAFLSLSPLNQNRFIFGRRARMIGRVRDLEAMGGRIDETAASIGVDLGGSIDEVVQQLRRGMV